MPLAIVISPAKKLNLNTLNSYVNSSILNYIEENTSMPKFIEQSKILIDYLRDYSTQELMDLMHISYDLAELNKQRFELWESSLNSTYVKPALFLFNGDVYDGIAAQTLSISTIEYIQKHLYILSGLYGLLKPLDMICPHRLEMGTKFLPNKQNILNNLYTFWQNLPTQALSDLIIKDNKATTLINLASNEYFKVIQCKYLQQQQVKIIDIVFEQKSKNNTYKNISFLTKKARGLMVKYMAEKNITLVSELYNFNIDNYVYQIHLSSENKLVFHQE
jgi:uncharacterized protein